MSTIISSVSLRDVQSNIKVVGGKNSTPKGSAFLIPRMKVAAVDETLPLGDVTAPDFVVLRLLSGDDCMVGFDGASYPLRLSGVDDAMLLRLDVKGRSEITSVVVESDGAGGEGGDHLVLREYGDAVVWPWFDTGAGAAASGVITYGVPVVGDTVVVNGQTLTNVASAPAAYEFSNIAELLALVDAEALVGASLAGNTIAITADAVGSGGNAITLALGGGNTGSMTISAATLLGGINASTEPIHTTERLIRVVIVGNETDAQLATLLAAALNADAAFIASAVDDVVTFRAAAPTNLTAATAGDTGWAVPTVIQDGSAAPVVHLMSEGNSEVLAMVSSY